MPLAPFRYELRMRTRARSCSVAGIPGISADSDVLRPAHAVRLAQAAALLGLLTLGACGGTSSASSQVTLAGEGEGGDSEAYGEEARTAYDRALVLFRDGNCLEAEPKFASVRRQYPYSRFAALAELRVSDCKFEQKQYAEAIAGYREFVRFRPSHVEVVYARYRIAESYFSQIPADWFLVPPSYERDQGAAQDALGQLRRFILDFPEDTRVAEARRMEQRCLALLAEH